MEAKTLPRGDVSQQRNQRFGDPVIEFVTINRNAVADGLFVGCPGESSIDLVVRGANIDNAKHRIVALIRNVGDGPPSDDDWKPKPQGATWLPTAGGDLYRNSVPLKNLAFYEAPNTHPANNNKVYVAIFDKDSQTHVGDILVVAIFACLPTNSTASLTVYARNAVWFAFAPYEFQCQSTWSEHEDPTTVIQNNGNNGAYRCIYRPQFLLVPTGVNAASPVSIEPPADAELWRHGGDAGSNGQLGTYESNYKGRPGAATTLDGRYKDGYLSPSMGSENIQDASCDFISLIYMWDVLSDINGSSRYRVQQLAATALTPNELGILCTPLPLPTNAKRLYFAAHDSFEWSNNEGAVNLKVTWTKA